MRGRMPLTGKQRQHLRALAHHLESVVQVGYDGATEGVIAQIDEALDAHELLKVRISSECPQDRYDLAKAIALGARAEIVQIIGRVVVAFRRRPRKTKVVLPTRSGAVPRSRDKSGSKGRPPRKRAGKAVSRREARPKVK